MIRLYRSSGSSEIRVLGPATTQEHWARIRANVEALLKARDRPGTKLLAKLPWELREGTNYFEDEFQLLYAAIRVEAYVQAAALEKNPAALKAAQSIAHAFDEVGVPIRFIAFELDTESIPPHVASPVIRTDAAATALALRDAERLLTTNGPVSAVDRIHTALHGYLREVAREAELEISTTDSITTLWKALRTQHPGLSGSKPHGEHVGRIAMALASIVDALNTLRNHGSVAHANEQLLSEADAMLAVNVSRSILQYVEDTLRA